MKKENLERMLENMLSTGGDFAEIFLEDKKTTIYNYVDSNLDGYSVNYSSGLGLRLAKENNVYYAATNDFSNKNINSIINSLKENVNGKAIYDYVSLNRIKKYKNNYKTHYTNEDIKKLFNGLDKKIRIKDERINQVSLNLQNVKQNVTIARENGLYKKEERERTRLYITISLKDNDKSCNIAYSYGKTISLDLLDEINYDEVINNLVKEGLDKLYAKPCVGGEMPVIIENGFGGVIFHEACGHAMEATSVADKISVLSHDLSNKIASEKVSIIDDGTLYNEWGSSKIDDEGRETKINKLIDKGVLTGYLIDEINNRKMKMQPTGSSRRESYIYAPTSRMNNTYLEKGSDTFEEMIKDIKLGLYAKKMGGGCVSPETGDFNFACDLAYMIRDGKIAECVKSASLIGNCKDILQSVEMVGDNLALGQGMCGSISGSVPVNVGMPRIKVGHILVGGEKDE